MSSTSDSQQYNSLQHYFSGIPVITKFLLAINCIIYLLSWILTTGSIIHNASLSAAEVLSPNYEISRMLTYAFVHMSFLHILMNMMTLLHLGASIEQQFGSVPFLVLTVIGLIFVPLLYVFLEWSAYAITNSATYLHTGAVGYSGMLFLYAVVEAFHDARGNRLLCGIEIPSYLYPFLMLFALQVLVPGVSFVGHVSGVLVGLVIVSGFCACVFPSQVTMISHFENQDSYFSELTRRLPSYVPVNTSQPEGFLSVSGIDSSMMRSPDGIWNGGCCDSSCNCCGHCLETLRHIYHRIRAWIGSLCSVPSQEYAEVARTESESETQTRGSATIHDPTRSGVGSSTRDAHYAHMEGGIRSQSKTQNKSHSNNKSSSGSGSERAREVVAEESSLAAMVRRGEQEDVRAIRLAKFSNIN